MFKANYMDSNCLRCDKVVYPTDKIGPLKDYSFFHSGCFRCAECFSKLTLKSYYNNQSSNEDKEVYCSQVNLGTRSHPSPLRDIVTLFTVFSSSQHVPKIGAGQVDMETMGIKAAMNVPKSSTASNEQIRPGGKAFFDAEALAIKSHLTHRTSVQVEVAATNGNGNAVVDEERAYKQRNWGRFDSSALHIQHALKQTAVQKSYHKPHAQAIATFLDEEVFWCFFRSFLGVFFRSNATWRGGTGKRRTGCIR